MSLADQLTDEQIAEAREVFNFYSKGPVLAVANCAVALRTCAANPSAGEIQAHLKGQTKLEFPEFLDLLAHALESGDGSHAILAAFKTYDKTGSGTVTTDELLHILCNTGEKLTKAEAKTFIDRYGGGGGVVQYVDFVKKVFA